MSYLQPGIPTQVAKENSAHRPNITVANMVIAG